jgi:hypothetical protein
VKYHLRGFDKRTEYEAVDFEIPLSMLSNVRALVPQAEDDPEFVDPHELTRDQAVRVAEALGVTADPDRIDYYVESDEDPYVVAAQVAAMRAKA